MQLDNMPRVSFIFLLLSMWGYYFLVLTIRVLEDSTSAYLFLRYSDLFSISWPGCVISQLKSDVCSYL